MSSHNDTIDKTIYKIRNGQLVEYAIIKIRHGSIIHLCTELSTSGVRKIHQENEFKCLYNFKISPINRNIIEDSCQKINYKIEIISYPIIIDGQNHQLYVYFTDKELIQIGLKEKQKRFRIKLNETQRWFIGLCVALFIGVGNWYFDFLPTRVKQSGDKHTDKTEYPVGKTIKQLDTLNLRQKDRIDHLKSDTLILRNDSLDSRLND